MPMNLAELKAVARNLGFKNIKRDGDDSWRELKTWNGFSPHTESAMQTVQVSYYLSGNRLTIRRALDEQEYGYTLS